MQLDLFGGSVAVALPALAEPAAIPVLPATVSSGPPALRYYQTDVLARGRAHIGKGRKRGVIQGETGCGKTFIQAELARGAWVKGRRGLLLADRRRLVGQLTSALDRFGVPYGVIMAGSTRLTSENIIVASRDTLVAWAESGYAPSPFDVIMIDECHKAMAATYQQIVALWPEAVVVGFTATPARGDGKSLGKFFGWLECTVPASQLIREGYLLRPEVYAPLELAQRRKSGAKTRGLAGDPVQHWRRHAEGLPTIAFARTVSESIALRDRFAAAGIPAEHVDASTPDDASSGGREAAFERLAKRQTLILSSVGLLIEGVDIPEAACALIWSPFGSLVQWRQACGRIMRPCVASGKTRAVVLDHAGAAGVHGLPGDDVDWSLDETSTVQDRRKEALEKGDLPQTIYCPKCGCGFKPPQCPSCGYRVKGKSHAAVGAAAEDIYEARDEVLARMDGETARGQLAENRERYWKRCVGIAVARGQSAGQAAAMFSSRFGVPPWSAGVGPLPERREDWKRPAQEVFPSFGRPKREAIE